MLSVRSFIHKFTPYVLPIYLFIHPIHSSVHLIFSVITSIHSFITFVYSSYSLNHSLIRSSQCQFTPFINSFNLFIHSSHSFIQAGERRRSTNHDLGPSGVREKNDGSSRGRQTQSRSSHHRKSSS